MMHLTLITDSLALTAVQVNTLALFQKNVKYVPKVKPM